MTTPASPETPAPVAPLATPTAPAAPAPAAPAPPSGLPGRRFLAVNAAALSVGVVLLGLALAIPRGVQGAPAPGGSKPAPDVRAQPTRAAPNAAGGFALALWDDGKAEVSRYTVREPLYGKVAQFERVRVVVKELFDRRKRTKTDVRGPDALDSLKLVDVDDVPTGHKYSYRQTLAVRVARSQPERVLEATLGLQEWCGNTFVLVAPRGDELVHGDELVRDVHSYWENEGDRRDVLAAGTLLEDQLALTLRAQDLTVGTKREIPLLLPTLVTSRQPASRALRARVAVQAEEALTLPAGAMATVRVRVDRGDGVFTTYWFDKAAPHVCAKWISGDGRQGLLLATARDMYWRDDPNKPCDCEPK